LNLDEWSARELQVMNVLKLSNVTNNDTLQSDEVQLHPLIFGFIDPVQKKSSADLKMEIPLKIIREISNDRHRATHSAIKSVIQQRLFIMKCVNYQYPKEYEFNEHLQKILNLIVELDTDPTTCKLKRFK